ncbi:MAG: tol-pal system protein YbgF [Smithellaceae bacterium]|nr:tol-pal system protein YbgF [Smithellaceae bacterium]
MRGTLQDVEGKQKVLESRVDALEEKTYALEDENIILREEIKSGEASIVLLKKNQDTARENVSQLRDALSELRKDVSVLAVRANRKDEEMKEVADRLDNILLRVSFLEKYLGLGKKDEHSDATDRAAHSPLVIRNISDKEVAYAAAYELFKDQKYDRARTEFQAFLKSYPDTEYSDNAQFWIAESYYLEKQYDKALAEYEKVTKNYPDGDKASSALLRQGLCLFALGNKAGARLAFQQVIKYYPRTNLARQAREKLLQLH